MLESGAVQRRKNIAYFEGVNSSVDFNVAKETELIHAENARSKIVGSIEKREGQAVLGLNSSNQPFVTSKNYGLFSFQNDGTRGFYRISVKENPILSINVGDVIFASDLNKMEFTTNPNTNLLPLTIVTVENINIQEQINNNTGDLATIYYINSSNQWIPLSGNGSNIAGGVFNYTYAEDNLFLVNQNDDNRYIKSDGVIVITSNDPTGHLWNTPPASMINYYKSRLYLADFIQTGVRYKTTVLRSSYVMGIISLVNEDVTEGADDGGMGGWSPPSTFTYMPRSIEVVGIQESITISIDSNSPNTYESHSSIPPILNTATGVQINVTDTTYFYTDTGANTYDIYRGGTYIASLVVTYIGETYIQGNLTSLYSPWDGNNSTTNPNLSINLESSDEIWISGTFEGSKIFRWVNNGSVSGRNVKQYDTFKLAGGENDPITMLTNIGNVMMIANKNNISTWNDFTLENFDIGIGCVSKKGYVKCAGTLYFLDYTGVYSTTGAVPTILSNKVQRYITGATKDGKESCAAGKKGLNVFFTLGDVTLYNLDGSIDKVLLDVCLEYNIVQQNWYVHTNVKASEFSTFMEEIDPDRLEFTDTSGNNAVKEFLSGETDDGQEISFRIDTVALTTGVIVLSKARVVVAFEYSTTPIALLIELERGSAVQAFVNLDNETGFYPLEGNVKKGLSIVKINNKDDSRAKPPASRLVSISLRDTSKQICKISRLTLIYIPTSNEIQDNEGDQ